MKWEFQKKDIFMIIILINFNDMKIIKRVKEDLENNSNLYRE
jgi:hypothetical protein